MLLTTLALCLSQSWIFKSAVLYFRSSTLLSVCYKRDLAPFGPSFRKDTALYDLKNMSQPRLIPEAQDHRSPIRKNKSLPFTRLNNLLLRSQCPGLPESRGLKNAQLWRRH